MEPQAEAEAVAHVEILDEIDQEDPAAFDVVRVLKNQNTHDLYCPHCNSCITRRVILRRRQSDDDIDRPTLDVLGCLACLSLFTYIGNGFKLFRCFGDGDDQHGEVRTVQNIPQNWFFSIFAPDKIKLPTGPEYDVVVITETQTTEVVSSLGAQNVGIPTNTESLPQTEIAVDENKGPDEVTEAHQWDILKSIVYGGFTESITSLGVVTSAAAAGASTLNILAMGLANLMGGLFVVAHNLRELKNETSTGTNGKEDRYQQLLGRRENFWVHATVVVLSYLIFGLMPPVIYGFSFRNKSDNNNRDLKIAAVAGSSLACIIFLAIAKVRIQKPPKSYVKTVSYYVSIALASSGLSYVVGDLIKQLLDNLIISVESISDLSTGRAFY